MYNSGIVANEAEILANCDPDVSVLSPVSTPRVPDVPVGVGGTIVVVAGQLNAVIDGVGARCQNTSLVGLPSRGINANRDGTTRGRAELLVFTRLTRDGSIRSNAGYGITARELARIGLTTTSSVGVVGIAVNTAGALYVLVGSIRPATGAAVHGSVAVYDLFHGELSQSSSLNGVVRLDGLSGRESPAGTALSLVVDGGDDAS